MCVFVYVGEKGEEKTLFMCGCLSMCSRVGVCGFCVCVQVCARACMCAGVGTFEARVPTKMELSNAVNGKSAWQHFKQKCLVSSFVSEAAVTPSIKPIWWLLLLFDCYLKGGGGGCCWWFLLGFFFSPLKFISFPDKQT